MNLWNGWSETETKRGTKWRGRGLSDEWREGIICPSYKKEDKGDVKNFGSITLLNTAYKIYSMFTDERLANQMEKLKMLPEGQAGFRKERSTTDNVYILVSI